MQRNLCKCNRDNFAFWSFDETKRNLKEKKLWRQLPFLTIYIYNEGLSPRVKNLREINRSRNVINPKTRSPKYNANTNPIIRKSLLYRFQTRAIKTTLQHHGSGSRNWSTYPITSLIYDRVFFIATTPTNSIHRCDNRAPTRTHLYRRNQMRCLTTAWGPISVKRRQSFFRWE